MIFHPFNNINMFQTQAPAQQAEKKLSSADKKVIQSQIARFDKAVKELTSTATMQSVANSLIGYRMADQIAGKDSVFTLEARNGLLRKVSKILDQPTRTEGLLPGNVDPALSAKELEVNNAVKGIIVQQYNATKAQDEPQAVEYYQVTRIPSQCINSGTFPLVTDAKMSGKYMDIHVLEEILACAANTDLIPAFVQKHCPHLYNRIAVQYSVGKQTVTPPAWLAIPA
jgi:hypothetical protein